jgi:hypothetical protein
MVLFNVAGKKIGLTQGTCIKAKVAAISLRRIYSDESTLDGAWHRIVQIKRSKKGK